MSSLPKLVQLSYSPWSERARWALDHHAIAYRPVEHTPFLGELRLRRIAGKGRQRATVPVLVDGDTVLADSWDIARYADRVGSGPKLIPPAQEVSIREWVELADQTSSHGRGLVVAALLASDAAVDEGLPFPLPDPIRPLMRPLTRFGLRWFARKYQLSSEAAAELENKMRPALDRLKNAIKASPYLAGTFSFADIAMATVLQGIAPVGNGYIRLGPATRRAWTRPTLESAYPSLVRWRDNLYLEHRGRAVST